MTHNNTMAVFCRFSINCFAATLPYFLLCLLACMVVSFAQAESRFSLEGQLNLGTDVIDIPFTLSTAVTIPDSLEFRTWSHAGGTNNAGDVIPAGGFDPTLALLDSTPTLIAVVDDGTGLPNNFDSLLSFASGSLPSPLTAGDYTLRLEALNDSFGTGTKNWAVDLTGPDDVLSLKFYTIDLVAGSAGISKVSVTGAGSQWNNSSSLSVGDSGAGTLNVEAGGVVTSTSGNLGHSIGSTGTAIVTGTGSQWNNSGILYVGDEGDGTLQVVAGGVIANTIGIIGRQSNSTSAVTVAGVGSQWNNSDFLFVGDFGNGTLNIEAGGIVTNTEARIGAFRIGAFTSSIGTATVTGAGSQWNNSSDLSVGGSFFSVGGTGTLDILDDGLVSAGGTTKLWAGGTVTLDGGSLTTESFDNTEAGTFNFHDGTLTVNGAGGTFNPGTADFKIQGNSPMASPTLVIANTATATLTGNLTAGNFGNGNLRVESGGVVSNVQGLIGLISSASAEATVTGAGSQWNNSGNLSVGQEGTGTLTVESGGVVSSVEGTVSLFASSTSTATVTGAGSEWNNSSSLLVGKGGDGTLNVEAGGMVTSTFGFIASDVGSVGNVTVTGAGSQWNNSAHLYIGGSSFAAGGTATLGIGDGFPHDEGTVTVAGVTKLWAGGTLTIDGHESTLTTGSFDNSEGGTFHFVQGVLNVNGAGGTFNPGTADFVLDAGESVRMAISNTATASLTGDLTVGNTEGGSASLYIESGSTVSNTDGYIAREDSFGQGSQVIVTGSGSEWNNANNVYVGGDSLAAGGTGTLEILDSGSVLVQGTTKLWAGGIVTLDGGTLDTSTLDLTEGTFEMFSGALSTLSVLGDLDNQGGVLVADSLVFITGDYTQANAASLDLDIPGSLLDEFGSLSVSGQVNLDGALNVSNGSSRMAGDFFTIIGGAINGVFDTINISGTPLAPGLEWQVDYFANRVDLLVSLSGDFNGDGTVDAADYTVWRDGLGTTYTQADYGVWVNHFGATASSSTSTSSVPEPTTLLLAVLCLSVQASRGRSLR